jgi:hypothetical protein
MSSYQFERTTQIGDRPEIKPGDKWNRLTILSEADRHPTTLHRRVLCLCDCGTEKVFNLQSVRLALSKSCGCLTVEKSQRRCVENGWTFETKSPEEVARYHLFNNYRGRARKYGMEFSLTQEQFKNLIGKPCAYCKRPPYARVEFHGNRRSTALHRDRPPGKSYSVVYTGIDRVDSSKGYTVDNCVPCCKPCNYAKGNMSFEEFKKWSSDLFYGLKNQSATNLFTN